MPDSAPLAHNHELDDKLHAGCLMCDKIKRLRPQTAREKEADKLADRYSDIARKRKEDDADR